MKASILWDSTQKTLLKQLDSESAQETAYLLFQFFAGLERKKCHSGREIEESKALKISNGAVEISKFVPIPYVLGFTYFCETYLKVTKDTFIPRSSTETAIQHLFKKIYKNSSPSSILDLCTGCGAVALVAKLRWQDAKITATEYSESALLIAQSNAEMHEQEIDFKLDNLLESKISDNFDLIICNPPYVLPSEKKLMSKEIEHEPDISIFTSEENPLQYHIATLELARKCLDKNGYLLMECNVTLINELKTELQKYTQFSFEFIKDDENKEHFVLLKRLD